MCLGDTMDAIKTGQGNFDKLLITAYYNSFLSPSPCSKIIDEIYYKLNIKLITFSWIDKLFMIGSNKSSPHHFAQTI